MPSVHQHTIRDGLIYLHHPDHRNWTHGKSKWSISEWDERDVFTVSSNRNWGIEKKRWGIYFQENRPAYLGLAQDHITQVFLAKFVTGNGTEWHGYPADHQKNNQDRPPVELQQTWMDDDVLPKAKIRKIAKGQPCNL